MPVFFGIPAGERKQRIQQLLEFADLTERAEDRVTALSGGMSRRLVLARALINQPEILVLDEPTTGLDPQARQILWQRLKSLKKTGATLLLTTHYMEEAERLCDRVIIIDHGKIIAEGSLKQLMQQHIEPYVIEIHGQDHRHEHFTEKLSNARVEHVGETIYFYSRIRQVCN